MAISRVALSIRMPGNPCTQSDLSSSSIIFSITRILRRPSAVSVHLFSVSRSRLPEVPFQLRRRVARSFFARSSDFESIAVKRFNVGLNEGGLSQIQVANTWPKKTGRDVYAMGRNGKERENP